MNDDDRFDYLFKIVFIGDCGVGKTSVVNRFRSGTYTDMYTNTIGVDFTMKTLLVDSKIVKLQIWDTAGQERFRTLTQSYYRNANGIIIVYDITNLSSFENVKVWITEVKKYTTSSVPLLLIGNKSDLEAKRKVPYEYAILIKNTFPNVIDIIETSAKEDTNVEGAFITLAEKLKQLHNTGDHVKSQGDAFVFSDNKTIYPRFQCCK